jgi:hypothetical protein
MTEAVIEPKTYFNLTDWLTDWNLLTFRKSTIVAETPMFAIEDIEDDSITELFRSLKIEIEDDSITELRRSLKQELSVESTNAKQALLAALFGLTFIYLLTHHPNRTSVAEVSSKESAADTQLTAIPGAVQAFFQCAESRLSAETEITAQRAQKLLRRIRELVVKICPSNLQGRVLAVVDVEDGSTSIEWIRNRGRLGFVLDFDENESSWFIVLPNGLSRSGYLYGNSGLKSLRGLLEEFIAAGE